MKYKIEVLHQFDKTLIHEWKELWKKAENANIYNSYEWFLTNMEINKNIQYTVYACYRDDTLVAILPLQGYKCFGINVMGSLDREHLVDTPFLIEKYDKETFKHFFGHLLKKKNIYLQKIDDRASTILHALFPELFIVLIQANPKIDLTKDLYHGASPSTISQIKRTLRKNPGIHFEMYTDNLQKHLETMFALQERSSKNARAMDIFIKEENKIYYRNLAKNCGQFVRINILYFNDIPITYEYGFIYKNTYAGDQISYHNDYKKLNPGKTMMFQLLDYLKKNNITLLDMGGGISSYKMSFTDDYRLLYNVYSSQYKVVMMWWKLINKARRIKQVLFPKKFTRDHEFLFKTVK